MKLGFDFGSKNIHFVALQQNKIIQQKTISHNGNVFGVMESLIQDVTVQFGKEAIESFGVTGSDGFKNIKAVDSILASIEANKFLNTGCQNILSIGCESFYLIFLDSEFNYIDHSVNTDCASGTGSFIDQQAKRLGYSTAEFNEKAFLFEGKSPNIATRCAVFAKSDIVHSQAEGFSKEAIAAGICEGIARSVLSNVMKGRNLDGELLLIGGVGLNNKMVLELGKQLGQEVKVPYEGLIFNALGAALLGKEMNISALQESNAYHEGRDTRQKLEIKLTNYPDFNADKNYKEGETEVTIYDDLASDNFDAFLGIDVGSTSTKLILIDEEQRILVGLYTRTSGEPVDAVARLLQHLKIIFTNKALNIKGVAVTGSGRMLIKEIIGADIAINEITSHAKGVTFLDPEVDTIIEIGGQDSKFTLLNNGFVGHSVMNYVCAAGTGSFIEEQAKKLDIELDDISEMALGQEAPLTSDRCTVYMERDINVFLVEGWKKEQIIASVLFSVRDNYLSKVAGRALFGNKVSFQGATAKNKALVAAFENEIGKPIFVSKYCHLTGALGAALGVKELKHADSSFRGIDFEFRIGAEICDLCANKCDLSVYTVNERKVAWGMKCGRDYEDKKAGNKNSLSNLEKSWLEYYKMESPVVDKSILTIGLPNCLYIKEYADIFYDFFRRLGFNVIIENNSAQKMEQGKEIACADFCTPLIIAHGVVKSLVEKNVDYIFFPALINEQSYLDDLPEEENFMAKNRDCYFCYYSAYAATIIDNLLTLDLSGKMISPKIKFNNRSLESVAEQVAESLQEISSVDKAKMIEVFMSVHQERQARKKQWEKKGQSIIETDPDKIKILLLGRPYVIFDRVINNSIPSKFEALGFDVIHQSMLDLRRQKEYSFFKYADRMHWYYVQQILLAAETAIKRTNVYPVFLTNFRCSPDAYAITYFKEMMEEANKPYLIIQLDEHCSDVGYQTRIEAGIDAFLNDFENRKKTTSTAPVVIKDESNYEETITKEDTVFFPYLSNILDTLVYSAFEASGYKARAMPLNQKIINQGYKYVSGGECLPNVAVVGSVIELFNKNVFDPKKSVIYFGDSCLACNFHQYTSLIKAACKKAGIEGLRIYSPKLGMPRKSLPMSLSLDMTAGCVLGSLLYKLLFRFRPYEKIPGVTQRALEQSIEIIKKHQHRKIPLWEIPLQKLGGKLGEKHIRKLAAEELSGGNAEPPVSNIQKNKRESPAFAEKLKEFLHPSKYMLEAAKEIRSLFESIPIEGKRKPRVGLLGDLYVKYNIILNEDIYSLIEELGGEILIPSYLETGAHLMDASTRESGADKIPLIKLTMYEQSFEHIFKGMLDDCFEPPVEECVELLREYGIKHYIPGETTINVCRFLYYAKHKLVDAVIHINPILCCPGSVTTSIYRKLQKDFDIPIVDIFYDGINKPNKLIIPQMNKLNN